MNYFSQKYSKFVDQKREHEEVNYRIFMFLLCGLWSLPSLGMIYTLPNSGDVIGEIETIESKKNDTLSSIAERFSIGQGAILKANPSLKKNRLKIGTRVQIPSQFKLPTHAPREGLVIDLENMRVYYYHPNKKEVSTYPIGIGRQGWDTPTGQTTIVSKEAHPDWHPPASIRREAASNGHPLRLVVPAGPHNPLGQYALHLGITGILMHGTTAPSSVGLRRSHGCMRMYAQDIEALFHQVPIGTPVYLINDSSHAK